MSKYQYNITFPCTLYDGTVHTGVLRDADFISEISLFSFLFVFFMRRRTQSLSHDEHIMSHNGFLANFTCSQCEIYSTDFALNLNLRVSKYVLSIAANRVLIRLTVFILRGG